MKLRIAILTLLLAATPAAAQSNAQAEQLFRDGKRLMSEKKFAEACAAFEASQKLDPTSATLMNLAACREQNGQIASAWGLFLEAERTMRGDASKRSTAKIAKERATALEPRVSYLIINVPDESRVDGLSITRNGEVIDPLTWNRALPVDGGEYVIEGKAPGHEPWQTRVTVAPERDKESVDVPKFKAVPLASTPPDTTPDGEVPYDDEEPGDTGGGMSGKRKIAIGAGAVGLVALGAAGFFELQARSDYDASIEADTNEERTRLYDDAKSNRTLAIGAGVAGGLCVGVAAYLWFTGGTDAAQPDEQAFRMVPSVGPDAVGVTFSGGF